MTPNPVELPRSPGGRRPWSSGLVRARATVLALLLLWAGVVIVEFGLVVAPGDAPPSVADAVPGDRARGEYLASVFACQDCHSLRGPNGVDLAPQTMMAGGIPFPGPWGTVTSKNVTQIAPTLSDAMLESMIRGRVLFLGPMPTAAYNQMATEDMRDLIAYVRTLPAVDQPLPPDALAPGFVMPPPNPVISVPALAPSGPTAERGAYLVQQGACVDCHTPRRPDGAPDETRPLAGGGQAFPQADGHVVLPPNLTPAGPLQSWSDDEIARAIRLGRAADGHQLNPIMPYASAFHAYSDTDVRAVVAYLRSLPPVVNDPPPNPVWPGDQQTG